VGWAGYGGVTPRTGGSGCGIWDNWYHGGLLWVGPSGYPFSKESESAVACRMGDAPPVGVGARVPHSFLDTSATEGEKDNGRTEESEDDEYARDGAGEAGGSELELNGEGHCAPG